MPGDMNYADWLAKKPAAFQDEVWRNPWAPVPRWQDAAYPVRNNAGREYTLDELRKRDAAAFKRAGP